MLKYRSYLLLTSFIWGSTFIFQRLSTETMGAYSFGAVRFLLGSIAVLPLVIYQCNKNRYNPPKKLTNGPSVIIASLAIGTALFAGTCLQQFGLFYTSAGKSAFITALYIVIVPILALYFYQPLRISHLLGIILAVTGVYLLAFHPDSNSLLNFGDLLTLLSAFCWSLQIILVDRFVRYHSDLYLAFGQFIVCSLLCFLAAFLTGEALNWTVIKATAIPILYAGIFSSGIAFTLQIIGQSKVPPTEGSMIMSLEMVFAAVLGYIFLGETLMPREMWGAIIMSIGVVVCQLPGQILWVRKRQ